MVTISNPSHSHPDSLGELLLPRRESPGPGCQTWFSALKRGERVPESMLYCPFCRHAVKAKTMNSFNKPA
ncbi:hypothetical protein KIPB_013516, partial [Kipferlia bialata]|eukprot:g13516.t1